jgi:hypothetical protein
MMIVCAGLSFDTHWLLSKTTPTYACTEGTVIA